jgi:hypothetical protein
MVEKINERLSLSPLDKVSIDGVLTDYGKTAPPPFVMGPVGTESGVFYGRRGILEAMITAATKTNIAVIEGGYRTGKTSLLFACSEELERRGLVQTRLFFSLSTGKELEDIRTRIVEHDLRSPAVIVFDETIIFVTLSPDKIDSLIELIQELKDKGHFVVMSFTGDLTSGSDVIPGGVSSQQQKLLEVIPRESIIVNTLLGNEEIREIVAGGEASIFTEPVIQYLTQEAGGHPLLANLVAYNMYHAWHGLKEEVNLTIPELMEEFDSMVTAQLGNFFAKSVEMVVGAGFNPLTWEYVGKARYKPDERVYKNMLPATSGGLFRRWLIDFLRKNYPELSGERSSPKISIGGGEKFPE